MRHSQRFLNRTFNQPFVWDFRGLFTPSPQKQTFPRHQKTASPVSTDPNDTFSPHARAFEPPRVPVHGSIVPFASASWVDEAGAPPRERERKIWTAASSHGMLFFGACQEERERKKSILIFMKGTLLTFTIHDLGCLYRYFGGVHDVCEPCKPLGLTVHRFCIYAVEAWEPSESRIIYSNFYEGNLV